MLPGITLLPPKILTPRRWLFESRPLREEPPAFLWAMVVILNSFLALNPDLCRNHHFLPALPPDFDFLALLDAALAGFFADLVALPFLTLPCTAAASSGPASSSARL